MKKNVKKQSVIRNRLLDRRPEGIFVVILRPFACESPEFISDNQEKLTGRIQRIVLLTPMTE